VLSICVEGSLREWLRISGPCVPCKAVRFSGTGIACREARLARAAGIELDAYAALHHTSLRYRIGEDTAQVACTFANDNLRYMTYRRRP
jgi:hypothetical protein